MLAAGLGEAYEGLKPPIDSISYLRPLITFLYLGIAARFLMTASDSRKATVLSLVTLAALLSVGANYLGLKSYIGWVDETSNCSDDRVITAGIHHAGESALKDLARGLQAHADAKGSDLWDVSIQSEGRTLKYTYRFKKLFQIGAFNQFVSRRQKDLYEDRCSDGDEFMIDIKAIETHTYYSVDGERLTSFSIDRSDCPQW